MPTARPRLSVTLTPAIDRALSGFCETLGISRSAFIVSTLETALPQLERMARLVQQLKQASPEALAVVGARMGGLEAQLQAIMATTNAPLDLFELPPEHQPRPEPVAAGVAGAGTGRKPQRAASPLPVNKGGETLGKEVPSSGPASSNVVVMRKRRKDPA